MHTDPRAWANIRRRVLDAGESIRAVARTEGMSRNTIRKMVRSDPPARIDRPRRPNSIEAHSEFIAAALLEDENRPQADRRSVATIYRLLRDEQGYQGGYDAVRRYCRRVHIPQMLLTVRAHNGNGPIERLSFTRSRTTYVLGSTSRSSACSLKLRLDRDRRFERKAEVARWIDDLRGDRLPSLSSAPRDMQDRLLLAVHDKSLRRRNRAIAALAHGQGFPVRQICLCLGVSRKACRRYVQIYRDGGAEALLAPQTRGTLKAEQEKLKAAVFRTLHEPPSDHGFNRTSWIMRDLRAALARQGHEAGLRVLRQIIHDAGWKWRKARIALTSNDPAYREKLSAVQAILSSLAPDEAFFSIDEFGPFAVKMKQGLKLDPPGPHRVVPQWQKSKGCMIMTAALELSGNQITHFYSDRKNTTEMIRMMDVLIYQYANRRTIYLSWDAASWHVSKKLMKRIEEHNATVETDGGPRVATAQLPAGAQFLNVIESVFSGMARAILHNSNYASADAARAAIDGYFSTRNQQFRDNPKRAGKRIWGDELIPAAFSDSNNCKNPRWR